MALVLCFGICIWQLIVRHSEAAAPKVLSRRVIIVWTVESPEAPEVAMMETMVSTEAHPVTFMSATTAMPRAPTAGVGKSPMDEIALGLDSARRLGGPPLAESSVRSMGRPTGDSVCSSSTHNRSSR
jgi:hypothetical protein